MRRHLLVADRADHFISGNRIIFSQLPLRSYLLPFNKRFHSGLCVILFSRLLLINSFPPSPVFHCSPGYQSSGVVSGELGVLFPEKKIYPGIGIGCMGPFVMEPPRSFPLGLQGRALISPAPSSAPGIWNI
ncbi:hypothetical protein CDAR_82471 [Caerostris darwini]|uniref:Uncharacterized protein n=1 Tax=Caerostris darwini TaxID=1538125 RepID=A0AAV4Q010_9ARAC|nr:hypothetical protein CDAR_82471 [Caerostris darwini]